MTNYIYMYIYLCIYRINFQFKTKKLLIFSMSAYVRFKITSSSKGFWTLWTFVRTFSSVRTYVPAKLSFVNTILGAMRTLEWMLARMRSDMPLQLPGEHIFPGTELAFVSAFTVMISHMLLKLGLLNEISCAALAFVRLFAWMRGDVILKIRMARKSSRTVRTLKWAFTCMDAHVLAEI